MPTLSAGGFLLSALIIFSIKYLYSGTVPLLFFDTGEAENQLLFNINFVAFISDPRKVFLLVYVNGTFTGAGKDTASRRI